jgi:hypothetical protein
MIFIYVRQTIGNLDRCKEAFDSQLAARQAGGATAECVLLRNADDPQEIIVLMSWRDLRQARLFAQSVSWQIALQQMGVVGLPEVLFLEEA